MGDLEVARSRTIAAPRDRVHALIDAFHAWRQWSPWEDVDPDLQRDCSGVAWERNRKAGKGNMEILSSTPERVEVRLTFEKPWNSTNHVAFDLTPSGDAATDVTWRMTGRTTGFASLFSKVVSMDRLVGKDFEKGLDRLDTAATTAAATH